MLLSAVSVLVVAQSSSEIPEGLINNPVYHYGTGNVRVNVTLNRFLATIVAVEKQ